MNTQTQSSFAIATSVRESQRLPHVLLCYPNPYGETNTLALQEITHHLDRYPGGIIDFFCEAAIGCIDDNLPGYVDRCCEVFQSAMEPLLRCNALTMSQYDVEYRFFRRVIFELWRYTRTSMTNFLEKKEYKRIHVVTRDYEARRVILCISVD